MGYEVAKVLTVLIKQFACVHNWPVGPKASAHRIASSYKAQNAITAEVHPQESGRQRMTFFSGKIGRNLHHGLADIAIGSSITLSS